jgi:hypothetical protein
MSWKCRFINSFPLSVRTQIGRLFCTVVEYLGSLRIDLNADVTEVRIFDFRGTIFKNFEKTSIAVNRYL